MNKGFLALLLSATTMWAWANQPAGDAFIVGPVSEKILNQMDVGCVLSVWGKGKAEPTVFIESPTIGAWMRINNQDAQLHTNDDIEKQGPRRFTYQDAEIFVDFGPAVQNEGGASFDKAKIRIKRNGKMQNIPVHGSCGC